MTEALTINGAAVLIALIAGIALGGFYFGGLWWTVRALPDARRPARLYIGSLLARISVVMAAFYGMLAWYSWPALLVSLAGFVAIRLVMIRYLSTGSAEATG